MTGYRWQTVVVGNRRADVFAPEAGTVDAVALYLHGYSGETLQGRTAFERAFEAVGLPVVCPRIGQFWWLGVVDPEFDGERSPIVYLREAVVPWVEATFGIAPPRLGVFGVETGGQGALQLAYRHARQFPVVAAVSPKLDLETWYGAGTTLDRLFPNAEAVRQHGAMLQLQALNWPKSQLLMCDPADEYAWEGTEILASKLRSTGIPFESEFVASHGGWGWEYADAMADRVAMFLAGRLRAL